MVLKRAMHCRLSQLLHINNVLVTEQYSFRKGISTENAAFRPTDSVFKSINQKKHVGGIFCDLAQAFECVNHGALFAKLHFYGIPGVYKVIQYIQYIQYIPTKCTFVKLIFYF
jgi:hypothetical protein